MCTVTFIVRRNGYALGMNRDEKLTRAEALPPSGQAISGRTALFPSEPNGGTWIGVNEAGVTFALINWYAVQARVAANAVSRGQLVRSALAARDAVSSEQILMEFPLGRTNPFRLISIFRDSRQIIEWKWNLSTVHRVTHEWKTNVWISSGFDETGAQRTRRAAFEHLIERKSGRDIHRLRAFHASHIPANGPYSVCMHRADAATVSYTEVVVRDRVAEMRYSPRPPCCTEIGHRQRLPLHPREIFRAREGSRRHRPSA